MPQYSPNLLFLHKCFTDENVAGCSLEGSSRSIKTWSVIDFLIWYASTREGKVINMIKETYNSFKTTLYDDFNRRLPHFGLQSPFADRQEVSSFNLLENKFNLLGDDGYKEGTTCDLFYCNEVLDITKKTFDAAEQRCREFWIADYNPKANDHWFYNATDFRKDVGKLKTTFKDNPYISKIEFNKISGYEPTVENARAGTADDFMWNVYGLGLRSAPEGLVFQNVTYVKDFPEGISNIYYGLDFGYTNSPSVLTKVGIQKDRCYAQKLFYAPTPSTNELAPVLKQFVKNGEPIWADPSGESGGRGMISQLRRLGFNIYSYKPFPGAVLHGISVMKKYKQFWIDDPDVRKEQTNYKYREVNGIRLDEPVDAFNHFIDSVRMPVMSNYR